MKQSCFHLASEKVRRKFKLLSREYLYRLPCVRKIQKGEINNLTSFFFIVNLSFFLLKQRKEEKVREAKEKENQVCFYLKFLFYYYILIFIVCLAKSHFFPKINFVFKRLCRLLAGGIRSYGDYCVAPNRGGCSPPGGSYLIFTKKKGTACNARDQIFRLDQNGVIHHKCSGKVVCPQGKLMLARLISPAFVCLHLVVFVSRYQNNTVMNRFRV